MRKPRTVQLLLALGADPNLREREQQKTSLHFAAWSGDASYVEILLKHSADPEAEDVHGHKPIYYGSISKNPMIFRALMAHMQPSIFTVAASGDMKGLRRFLIDKDAVLRADSAGLTSLHWAAIGGQQEVAKTLLEAGADPWARTKDGKLADVLAATLGYDEVSRTLRPPLSSDD